MENCNIENRTIFCKDNLDILERINNECIEYLSWILLSIRTKHLLHP